MISSLNIHNIKISLKLQIPYQSYFTQKTKQIKSLKFKNTLNFFILYSKYTYIFFKTFNNIAHCNVTKLKQYNDIYLAKKNLKEIFTDISITSTKVDNICATRRTHSKINLNRLFQNLTFLKSNVYKVNYNSQKFPGLFVKFLGFPIKGTLIIFKSGNINYVGIRSPRNFIEIDNWLNKWIKNV